MSNILKISDAASLGLHAMVVIGQKKEQPESVKTISETLGVSSNHMSKVLQRLVKAGLVVSVKGYGGGFYLAKDADKTSFLEIYEAIDGPLCPSNCLLDRSEICDDCILGGLLKSVNKQAREYFSDTYLSDFNQKSFIKK